MHVARHTLAIALALTSAIFVAGCAVEAGFPEDPTSDDELAGEEHPAAEENVASTSQAILGADACKGTEIVITNSRFRNGIGTAIDIHYVKYYSDSEDSWYTEDLPNTILNYGDRITFWNQDLAHAENDTLTKWRAYYRYVLDDGAGWSSVVYQEIDTPDDVCLAGDDYYLKVE